MPKELESLRKKISANLKGKINPRTKKPYTKSEIYAIAQAKYKKTKENKISFYEKVQFKEEGDEFYSEGFVATTHPDRAKTETHTGDILTKNAVTSVVEQINSRNGLMADLVSHRHDWVKEGNPNLPVAGRAVSAELRELPNGHFGAHVKTHHNKTHPNFNDHKYQVENKYLPGYSIEYEAGETKDVSLGQGKYRMINSLNLMGYGLANGRMVANPHAVIDTFGYKEIIDAQNSNTEEPKMPDEEVKDAPAEEPKPAEVAPVEPKEEPSAPADKAEPEGEAKEEVDAKEYTEFKKFTEMKEKKITDDKIMALVKERLSEILPENKIQMKENVELKEVAASIEFKEWKETNNNDVSIKEAFNRANAYAKRANAYKTLSTKYADSRTGYEIKTTGPDCSQIQVKALETDTNKSTDTDYLQSAAELSDIYAPAITKMLNQRTTYFGILPKEDWSGREAISWRAENVANASAGFYFEGGPITKGNTTRQKLREEFKYFSVGVQVTGQMIESAKSGVGDIFAIEVESSTRKALSDMNVALYAETGAFTDEEFLGLEYLGDSGNNTILYGLTRSTTNLLGASDSEYTATGGAPISKAYLRTAIRTLEVNGADRNSLIILCDPIQRDLILSLLDDAQRFNSTSARAGFEGQPMWDGVPIFSDKDCQDDDVYVVNLSPVDGMALAVQKPLTYEDLAKSDDSRSGFLKFYGNQYAKAPKRGVYMLQGLATS